MQFTAEHRQLEDTVIRFCDKEINPFVADWEDKGQFPAHEVFAGLAQMNERWNAWKPGDLSALNRCLRAGQLKQVAELLGRPLLSVFPLAAGSTYEQRFRRAFETGVQDQDRKSTRLNSSH